MNTFTKLIVSAGFTFFTLNSFAQVFGGRHYRWGMSAGVYLITIQLEDGR